MNRRRDEEGVNGAIVADVFFFVRTYLGTSSRVCDLQTSVKSKGLDTHVQKCRENGRGREVSSTGVGGGSVGLGH